MSNKKFDVIKDDFSKVQSTINELLSKNNLSVDDVTFIKHDGKYVCAFSPNILMSALVSEKLNYLSIAQSDIILDNGKEFFKNKYGKLVELTDERIDIEVKRKKANDNFFKSDIYHPFI